MTRAQVVKLARAKWGKKAIVEEFRGALDPETREIVKREHERHKAAKPVPPPEVIAFNQRMIKWIEEERRLRSLAHSSRRYRILEDLGLGRMFHGQGDTWEEAARSAKLLPPVESDSTAT